MIIIVLKKKGRKEIKKTLDECLVLHGLQKAPRRCKAAYFAEVALIAEHLPPRSR